MDLDEPQPEEQQFSPETVDAKPGAIDASELNPVAMPEEYGIHRFFFGPEGLRAGWSVLLFVILMLMLLAGLGFTFAHFGLVDRKAGITPRNMFFNELLSALALIGSMVVMALIERRSIFDYNLRGRRRWPHFLAGLAVGFVALSALVGSLAAGGWLHFGSVTLSGTEILEFGIFWLGVFLLVGLFEEGVFRCYLQATLTRGINFWWALGVVALICARLVMRHSGNGVWGDYALAGLGLLPCLWLHWNRVGGGRFWQAAWVTSTLFGYVHTGNGGENWVGIFAAGAIGFVFCVSVRLTGSAWWAIGAHAGWDWGETYFYGTPDSGVVATGHYLSTTLSGSVLWSGGSVGPEGSLLVLVVILLMLAWLLAVHGSRGRRAEVIRDAGGASNLATFGS